jgi:hypothetical protein
MQKSQSSQVLLICKTIDNANQKVQKVFREAIDWGSEDEGFNSVDVPTIASQTDSQVANYSKFLEGHGLLAEPRCVALIS